MIKVNMKLTILMVCVFCVIFVSTGWAEDNKFSATLSRSRIGPGHPVNTDASGEVFFQLDENKQELAYKLIVKKIKDVYMAHLHVGPCSKQEPSAQSPVAQGPIAAWLYPCPDHFAPDRCIEGEFSGTLAEGVIRPKDLENHMTFAELIEAIRNGNTYANVHTRTNVTGEICGQVEPQK